MKRKKDVKNIILFVIPILLIICPPGLFCVLKNIIQNNIFDFSFMDSTDNILLFFSTLVSTSVSGIVTFAVLILTFEHNQENLQIQQEQLENDYKKKLDLKIHDEYKDNINKAIQNISDIKTDIFALKFISLMNIENIEERYVLSKEDAQSFFKNFSRLDYLVTKIKFNNHQKTNIKIDMIIRDIKEKRDAVSEDYSKFIQRKNHKLDYNILANLMNSIQEYSYLLHDLAEKEKFKDVLSK